MRRNSFVLAIALTLGPAIAFSTPTSKARYRQLSRVVDRNTGHAHFTRSVNGCTILALRDATTKDDIPVLAAMLDDKDDVIGIAARYVLSLHGEKGIAILEARKAQDRSRSYDYQSAIEGAPKLKVGIDTTREKRSCRLRK
jgi:hypothetical protein